MTNFTLTLELKTEKWQEDVLDKRFNIGRQMYNACLDELYKRYNTMTERKEYKKVLKMPKGKDRNKKFQELNKKYGLTEYSLHKYVKPMQHYFKKNIDSSTAQKIATRVFRAFEKYMFHQAKRVYFKKYNELNSLEGKSNKTGIRFREDKLEWNKLTIPVIIKKNDVYAHMALVNKVKYCRILRRFIKDIREKTLDFSHGLDILYFCLIKRKVRKVLTRQTDYGKIRYSNEVCENQACFLQKQKFNQLARDGP